MKVWRRRQALKGSTRMSRPFAGPIAMILAHHPSQLLFRTHAPQTVATTHPTNTYYLTRRQAFPHFWFSFGQGSSLEIVEYMVLAERRVLYAARIFPIDVSFCCCVLCLFVNTEISLRVPKRGVAQQWDRNVPEEMHSRLQ